MMAKRSAAQVGVPARAEVQRGLKAERAEERVLAELASAGLLTRAEGSLTPFKPLRVAGKPLSETLLEDRNDRL